MTEAFLQELDDLEDFLETPVEIYKHRYSNGDTYEGGWSDNAPNGYGVYKKITGEKFEGTFSDGKRHGFGDLYLTNGDRYKGSFFQDKKSGNGVYTWASGVIYEGEFKFDQMHGQGILSLPNGHRFKSKGFKLGTAQGFYIHDILQPPLQNVQYTPTPGRGMHGHSFHDKDGKLLEF